ncbi:hypothetical protein [Maribacter luteus]|uniref:hypothetical protein n=1 Tax=Maribacter luteus TaxID=2594478 RepID=UPI0024916F37|nr:hypothetical protein [Maribacter luteus]|tara:strand:+ start:320 stop:1246 length:927 start_codon:yes stop_codon:yes gene_type:complete
MKKFLIKILLFTVAFFLAEKIFYLVLIASPKYEKDKRLEQVITGKMNKDIMIIGSSRGARDIIACQIEDSLGLSTYNLSYQGSDIEFHEFLLRSVLKFNKKPKMVLLTVDDPVELLSSELTFRYDRCYPLAKYKYINEEMILRGEKSFLSNFLVLARLNKRNFYLWNRDFTDLDRIMDCGSMPISFQREGREYSFINNYENYQKINEVPSKIDAFLKFQQLCITNDIVLYLVFPPNFRALNRQFENRLRQISDPKTNFFIYDTTNTIYRNKSYYFDESHLITKGAIVLTNELIEELRTFPEQMKQQNN